MSKKSAATTAVTPARKSRSSSKDARSKATAKAKAGDAASPKGEPKSAKTRARILDAAANVLSRRGYAGTRLTDVAQQAEIQAPAIYYYFPSREDLIEEVMWTGIAHMREHLQGVLDQLPSDLPPLARIEAAVEAHLRYELEISDYTTAAIRNAGQIPDELRIRYDNESKLYGDLWRKLFSDAGSAGELRSDLDPTSARMLVMGALSWAAEWWNPRRDSLDSVIRTAQSLVRHGLAASPAPATDGPGTKARSARRRSNRSPEA
ncbi:TetR/AcrR family transcriptional regulator [Haloechinothrix salitolerans]|uniref:TetR/AcrR family transcriptional regulator n=1 Tax=Haloechinothrix salitolerans TaxID=926830 RepID=A0ABW2BTE7_9PSEU